MSYDLAVIGAGSAGFSAATTAAEQGARVALVGHGTLGGTCVNVGCVPSKTLIHAAGALHEAAAARRFAGIEAASHVADWSRVIAAKDELVTTLRQHKYEDLLGAYPAIDYIEGAARLDAADIAVDGARIRARSIVIATGSSPSLPRIHGIDSVPWLTSTTALALTRLPDSLLVVGGGYVGCELAQLFARVGVDVTLLTRGRLLPGAEPEISRALAECLAEEGVVVHERTACLRVEAASGQVRLALTAAGQERHLQADRLLVATGRHPNSADMGLGEAGVLLHADGAVAVDRHMRTSRPSVYAAGDVTGRDPFVYMAAYGARLAALNAMDGDTHAYENSTMPWVVFTDPQVAGVGLDEAAARRAGFETRVSLLPLDQVPRALAARDTRGLIKLVADARSDRLLGAQVLAAQAGDSIQSMSLALRFGMTVKDLAATVFPYLTSVEGLRLAALGFDKDLTRLSCCAG